MKTPLNLVSLAFIGLLASSFQPSALGQGGLTPPGAPAPTMKSLSDIDTHIGPAGQQRTLISSAPFTITQPGSYSLAANLAVTSGNAITISADDVTLNLNGFTISSTEASPTGSGILLNGARSDIQILNGHIRGFVTESGGVYS